ncbi:MAG: hypothetical protein EB025_08310, partial [Chitinophagaceae bacterium]|nr:hypothetical protein [Chitinophagaceae bacterium]
MNYFKLHQHPVKVLVCIILILVNQAFLFGQSTDSLRYSEESHLQNVRQLTFGGDNAEAYWSYDGKSLVFQRTSVKDGVPCDQIFIGKVPTSPNEKFEYRLISTGQGRTTCAFFTKDNKHIIYA